MEDTNKTLGKVFGSTARAKVLRFFMQNGPGSYTAADVGMRTNLATPIVLKELSGLRAAGILRRRTTTTKKGRGKRIGWLLNEQFAYKSALDKFFSDALHLDEAAIIRTLLKVGRIKYIVLSGIFVGLPDARIDLLVVGDLVRPQSLSRALRSIEHTVCRELRLAYLTTSDFNYRRNVNDKLLRDVFDYSHKVVHDRLRGGISPLL